MTLSPSSLHHTIELALRLSHDLVTLETADSADSIDAPPAVVTV
jgi:hypothetical protein